MKTAVKLPLFMMPTAELLKLLYLMLMTNIRFIKKSRHPRRTTGENSSGDKGREENKSSFLMNSNKRNEEEKKEYMNFNNQYKLNFK
jgi:hypothetical protein